MRVQRTGLARVLPADKPEVDRPLQRTAVKGLHDDRKGKAAKGSERHTERRRRWQAVAARTAPRVSMSIGRPSAVQPSTSCETPPAAAAAAMKSECRSVEYGA